MTTLEKIQSYLTATLAGTQTPPAPIITELCRFANEMSGSGGYIKLTDLSANAPITYNNLTGTFGVDNTVTTQGNTFNGANQLVQLNATAQYPANDGSLITGLYQNQIQYLHDNDDVVFNSIEINADNTGILYKGANRFMHNYSTMGLTARNLFVGILAGNLNIIHNTALEGYYLTGLGHGALYSVTNGNSLTAIGTSAGLLVTSGYNCTFIGAFSGSKVNIGYGNNFIGSYSGYNCTSGNNNNYMGHYSGGLCATGARNTGVGTNSNYSNVDGNDNTCIGNASGYGITLATTLHRNVCIGSLSGAYLSDSDNIFIGYKSGYYETGNNKLFIDNQSRASEADARLKALIYGIFASTTASQYLYLNSNVQITEYLSFSTGGLIAKEKVRIVTTNTTIDENDSIIEVTTSGVTLTLRTAVGINGKCFSIDNKSTGDIYINTTSSQTIQDELIQTIPPNCCPRIYSDNANWRFR